MKLIMSPSPMVHRLSRKYGIHPRSKGQSLCHATVIQALAAPKPCIGRS